MLKNEQERIFIIKPIHGWVSLDLREVWQYREMLYFLVWREIKVRYKQTALGVAWAVIQPFFMMVIFSLLFGRFVNVPSEGIPYPLFNYAALLPWMLFSEGVMRSANSIVADGGLIRKVYFPRLIMPLSGVISPLVDFVITFLVFLGIVFYFRFPITIRILWLPVFILFSLITSLAVGLWLSAINVKYRDVRYIIPFLLQCWFFVSPIVYSSVNLPRSWHFIYSLNPMVGVIEGFRWVLLGATPPALISTVSFLAVLSILLSGLHYFKCMEKTFADVV